ncbi:MULTISPECIES: metallophosphoesterase [Flavobacterium]|uniref:Metallophosphoesterase n=1 Tax=Flavobacterium jumunjinense TaxID=998845 RepID=A0ABV5GQV5_9FLAO|nr:MULTISPECIES: metallophosphoesterase [Flavobacterium]
MKQKRTLVFGDIHGGLRALQQLFERAKITIDDRLIFLGDYVDGWNESAETVQFLIKTAENQECIFIRGNHDLWCGRWLELGASNPVWEEHGGKSTKESYLKTGYIINENHKVFFQNLKNYYIHKNSKLFLHAGFTSIHGVEKEQNESDYYFDRTLWETAVAMDKHLKKTSELYPKRLKHYNEIYIGHTPTINYGIDTPMNKANVWNIDTGAAFMGKLTCLDIETKEFWQSDVVQTLYPNEKGRN